MPKMMMSHTEVTRLALWVQGHKDELYGLSIEPMLALVRQQLGHEVTEPTLRNVCKLLDIKIKPRPRPTTVPESQVCRVLAKHVTNLYTQLGVAVPDDLWDLAGGRSEDE